MPDQPTKHTRVRHPLTLLLAIDDANGPVDATSVRILATSRDPVTFAATATQHRRAFALEVPKARADRVGV